MAVDGKILDQFEVKELGDASRTQKMNQLLIRYEYSVDGVKYVNDRVRYKWNNHNLDSERKRYPAGLDVTVLVNPENLSQSVLEPGINATNVFSFLAGLFILVSGVLTHFID